MYIQGGDIMIARLKQWGNSQAVRIPKELLTEAAITENDILEIEVTNGTIIIKKQFRHKTLEERIAAYGGKFSLDGEYDWGESVGREIW